MTSCYVHIPFCQKKCNYCAFCSFFPKNEQILCYFEAIKKELKKKICHPIKTLYFGGGTPSFVPLSFYESLHFDFEEDYEFTFEVNPATVDKAYLEGLLGFGVNRLSIGVQSFFDDDLKILGRIHSAKEAIECVELAHSVGFQDISVDLIYGLPNQNLSRLKKSLNEAIKLPINHLSSYGLKIEQGTFFGENPPSNLPDEDACADMYLFLVDFLQKNGFFQYEISNFAKNGRIGVHNSNYWENNEYIGIGLGASGYEDGVRYQNSLNFQEYILNPESSRSISVLNKDDILEEGIFLGLRMNKGLDLDCFFKKYGVDLLADYKHVFDKYKEFFIFKNNSVALNLQGFLISNVILSEFIK